jgi:VWFA-related protein
MLSVCFLAYAQGQTREPVFRNTTILQSVPVRVVDKSGTDVAGLAARDFTLLDSGRPQQISFFAAGHVPVSLAVLLDASRSMDFGGKLGRAREFLTPLLHANHPDDEIFFVPFTDRIEAFHRVEAGQNALPPARKIGAEGGGTALYDALASALCHLRTARNALQAIVVVTDGADQHSRLNLDQLIALTQSSNALIFTVGLFDDAEYSVFSERDPRVTLLGEHDIDNPVVVFDRLARESGAQSFFPRSEDDFGKALGRISAILQAQYTLAYCPHDAGRFRRIEVKVRRAGLRVLARRGVGAYEAGETVRFAASSCEVSPQDHPYPWETRTTRSPSGALVYREDFSNPASGWPTRREKKAPAPASSVMQGGQTRGPLTRVEMPSLSGPAEYRPGLRYVPGGFEVTRTQPPEAGSTRSGTVVAYGPSWDDFRASLTVETDWSQAGEEWFGAQPAMVFGLSESGYCVLLLRSTGDRGKELAWELEKRSLPDGAISPLIPWTSISRSPHTRAHRISVERAKGLITVRVDGETPPNASVQERTLAHGLIGFGLFGEGRAVFRDLAVEGLP